MLVCRAPTAFQAFSAAQDSSAKLPWYRQPEPYCVVVRPEALLLIYMACFYSDILLQSDCSDCGPAAVFFVMNVLP